MTRGCAVPTGSGKVRVVRPDGGSWDDVRVARTYGQRLRGLMFKRSLSQGEGLLFPRCTSVHSLFMRIPIDVVHLDADWRVTGMETLAPWRLGRRFPGTAHVLEVAAGSAVGLTAGSQLAMEQ